MAQVPPPTPTSSDLMLSLAADRVADDKTVDLVFRSSDYGVCWQNCPAATRLFMRQFYLH